MKKAHSLERIYELFFQCGPTIARRNMPLCKYASAEYSFEMKSVTVGGRTIDLAIRVSFRPDGDHTRAIFCGIYGPLFAGQPAPLNLKAENRSPETADETLSPQDELLFLSHNPTGGS